MDIHIALSITCRMEIGVKGSGQPGRLAQALMSVPDPGHPTLRRWKRLRPPSSEGVGCEVGEPRNLFPRLGVGEFCTGTPGTCFRRVWRWLVSPAEGLAHWCWPIFHSLHAAYMHGQRCAKSHTSEPQPPQHRLRVDFFALLTVFMADPSGRPQSSGVARRRRERRLRSMLRHERMTVAMAPGRVFAPFLKGTEDGQGRGVGARAELHGEDPEAPHTPAGALQPRRRARRGPASTSV